MKFTTRLINRLVIVLVVVAAGTFFYHLYFSQLKREREYVFIKPVAIQTSFGWGYEILADGKPYIHQEFIPGIKGRKGFDSKEAALRVADLVVAKIKRKEIPPAVSIEDLRELKIITDADSASIQH